MCETKRPINPGKEIKIMKRKRLLGNGDGSSRNVDFFPDSLEHNRVHEQKEITKAGIEENNRKYK
jgi:hypothetical protein